jgi:hypothetical protein
MQTTTKYYGFANASQTDDPAWFHTPAAARRFANACGWMPHVKIEECAEPPSGSIMDNPEQPWTKEGVAP